MKYKQFKSRIVACCMLALLSASVVAHESDDPLLLNVMLDRFEWQEQGDVYAVEADTWLGHDLHKLWMKVDAHYHQSQWEDVAIEALYSRAISPFWDAQIGVMYDDPALGRERTWGVIGLQGLAPYFFDIDGAIMVGNSGDIGAKFSAEYEILLTQQWIISPEVAVQLYGQNDPTRLRGSGLSEFEVGVRLRYEIRREFAPYTGVKWTRASGNTADYLQSTGQAQQETTWVLGVRTWF